MVFNSNSIDVIVIIAVVTISAQGTDLCIRLFNFVCRHVDVGLHVSMNQLHATFLSLSSSISTYFQQHNTIAYMNKREIVENSVKLVRQNSFRV